MSFNLINYSQQEFDQPLRIEDIAGELGMSISGFHHHFKAVTAISPLRFQKQLRLQDARRLMLDQYSLSRWLPRCITLQLGV